jgi:ATP-dependent HslUV protease ATP-binding subunit HslU
MEAAVAMVRDRKRREVRARAELAAAERLVTAMVGAQAQQSTKDAFRKKLRNGEMEESEIEIEMAEAAPQVPMLELPNMPGGGMQGLGEALRNAFGARTRRVRMKVGEAREPLVQEESDKLLDQDALTKEALRLAQDDGIVFLDEIDKIASRSERGDADVSREGVQRDLLPLIEGAVVATKYGPLKTDHILFIASGAFHVAKPSDLLPELQGRLPIRVELKPLTREDFRRILTEPEASLLKQTIALMATENVTLSFANDAIDAIAELAADVNASVENIGARRLQTVMERLMDELSFNAPDRSGTSVHLTGADVRDRVGDLAKNADLSRFIL